MPRTLAGALRSYVDAPSRTRGESYFRAGRVSVTITTSTSLNAAVRGTRRYEVTLSLEIDSLVATCTCPYFTDSFDPCKHVWATILAADEARVFTVPQALWLDTDAGAISGDEIGEFLTRLDGEHGSYEVGGRDTPAESTGKARLSAADRQGVAERMTRYWADRRRGRSAPFLGTAAPPLWQAFLTQVGPVPANTPPVRGLTGELIYVFDAARSASEGGLVLELMTRERKKSGDWAKPKALSINRNDLAALPDDRDRRILEVVCGARQSYGPAGYAWGGYGGALPVPSAFVLSPTLQRELVPKLCDTGRLLLRVTAHSGPSPIPTAAAVTFVPLAWDAEPARFVVRVTGDERTGYTITGSIRSGDRDYSLAAALFVTSVLSLWSPREPGGPPRFATLDTVGAERWMAQLLTLGSVTVPGAEAAALAETMATTGLAPVECPDELRLETRSEPPQPQARITRPTSTSARGPYSPRERLELTLSFRYGERDVTASSSLAVVVDRERRLAWRRDQTAERAAVARLQSLGVRTLADWKTGGTRLDLADTLLPTLARVLLSEGWHLEAEGRLYRQPGAITLDVRSGIDWFELHGGVDFDGLRADLPALLAAARRGDNVVTLGDGTFGLLPTEWLARSGRLAAMGTPDGDHLRFATTQAALLDAWLEAEPAVTSDEAFTRARRELAHFDGIAADDPPATFRAALRDYQRDALGWFAFLRRFGFGGCLADEMGLGKTVMVLAVLEARRVERDGRPGPPSLVVVPRSLVFNWRQEAARFAPALRVLDFTAGGRREALERIGDHDVVLATYGTLRRDIGQLKALTFDYVVLDEAQAIKNAGTSTAKTVRLLKADHRLALTGTPIENHLGELWSLVEFLNPGMLGRASMFSTGTSGRNVDDETLALLARGLRPFILRRTKDQVAAELPARTEQTLYCDLEAPQRALYNELRDHYRTSLLGRVAKVGLGKAKLQVLEALLRLRQAACHPGLIDAGRAGDPAAKLDILLPRLLELAGEGRKVLVFSQFTTLLGLLRTRLDASKLAYEYLDGQTRDRQARVERFQTSDCPLFLISLKAGGLGLNLTAAEYVFLLDPWWNPAVEAQAIDRAHRIGQTRPVFAFRLIARDTVEEKVLELQVTKRRLADAIVRADESLIRDLKREDLELLLS